MPGEMTMAECILDTEDFWEGVKKVGPGSQFRYRCIFDPVPVVEGELPSPSPRRDRGKTLLFIAGPNGSGKSSLVTSASLWISEDKIVNPDNYAHGITGVDSVADRYWIAMDVCTMLRESLLERGVSFGLETVASKEDKLEFAKRAKSMGYEIVLLFVTTGDPELCCQRIAQRVAAGGHDVPREKVFARFERTMGFLPKYVEIADRAEVFDNSRDGLVSILSKRDGAITVSEEAQTFEWVRKYLREYI